MVQPQDITTQSASEQVGSIHGSALATGAVVGTLVAAVVAGSVVLVMILLLGTVLGAMIAGAFALVRENLRGRRTRSGDRPVPRLTPDIGPGAERAEAGGPSPEPS